LRKEKELLANYEEKVNHMKGNLEREKELWLNEKRQREEEILDRREELVEAIQSIREQQRREAMESESQSHNSNHVCSAAYCLKVQDPDFKCINISGKRRSACAEE
jgi:hypothetical protein